MLEILLFWSPNPYKTKNKRKGNFLGNSIVSVKVEKKRESRK